MRCVFQEAVALPESDRGRECARLPSVHPRIRLAASGQAAHRRKARRDFSRSRRRARNRVQDLSIGRRQMVEVARAFTVTRRARAPGHSRRADLLARRPHRRPIARLRAPRRRSGLELRSDLASARRSARRPRPHRGDARRQGRRRRTSAGTSIGRKLVAAMGGVESAHASRQGRGSWRKPHAGPVAGRALAPGRQTRSARPGGARGRDRRPRRPRRSWPDGSAARRLRGRARGRGPARGRRRRSRSSRATGSRDGVFPQWSIAENIGVRSLRRLARRACFVSPRREGALAESWREQIRIRTPDVDNNILSLSGGNQQKALFARALGSDARIILMDDPMRGVDYRHQARGLRADPRGGAAGAHLSLVHDRNRRTEELRPRLCLPRRRDRRRSRRATN